MIYYKSNESFEVTGNDIRNLSEFQVMYLYIEFEHGVEGALVGCRLSELPLTGELTEQATSQM
jgi:hypothetical protein